MIKHLKTTRKIRFTPSPGKPVHFIDESGKVVVRNMNRAERRRLKLKD